MRRSLTLLLVFFPVIFVAQVQKMDSLEQVLKQTSRQTERYKLLNELAPLLYRFEKPEKAFIYLDELKKLAHNKKDYKSEALAYRISSIIYQNITDYPKAIELVNKATNLHKTYHHFKGYLWDINQLGRIYIDMQQPEKAIEVYKTAIEESEGKSNPEILRVLSVIYGNLGIAYGRNNQNDKEILFYIKQAKLAEKINSYEDKSRALYNIGFTYMNMEQYSKAEKYFNKSLSDSIKLKNKSIIYANYHALGILYSRWHKFDQALHYDSLALYYLRRNKYQVYVFDVLNNTAVVYQRMKQYDKALEYNMKAVKLADSIKHKLAQIGGKLSLAKTFIKLKKYNKAEKILKQLAKDTIDRHNFNKSNLVDFWEYNYEVYKHQKQYQKALEAFEKYNNIYDSISNKERDIKIAELETKYQSEAKEKELIQKEKELLKQKLDKQHLIISLGIAGLLLILLIFFTIKFYLKHRREKRELTQLTQKVKALTKQLINEEITTKKQAGIKLSINNHYNNDDHIRAKRGAFYPIPDDDNSKKKQAFKSKIIKDFHHYLKDKFGIDRTILIEVWASIANGISRKEFTKTFDYSENTVKAWRKDLYKILKQFDASKERYSDYKATGLYYQNFIKYLEQIHFFQKKN